MKRDERDKALKLRQNGESIKDIAKKLGVTKSSVSLWVRSVELTPVQRSRLSHKGYSIDLIEKRRLVRLKNEQEKRLAIKKQASAELPRLTRRDLWLTGIALYWGEGGKTYRGGIRLSNSDPAVIRLMMKFFREICCVPEEKFRGHIHTFSHLNRAEAEKYWSEVSGIPSSRFYKTYVKKSKASKNKKDNLPYGTFQIYVHDSRLFSVMMGWIERLGELTSSDDARMNDLPDNWELPTALLVAEK